jgi:hypothetical protein
VRDRSNRNMTVLQNYFPVNLHGRMTDSRIKMADCSNRAAERDPLSIPCGDERMRVMFYEAAQGMLVRAAKLLLIAHTPSCHKMCVAPAS